MDENLSLDLDFRAETQIQGAFLLHNSVLTTSPEMYEAFSPILTAVADTLRFTVTHPGPVPTVVAPIRRRWNADESALIDEHIAQNGDTLHVTWSADGVWRAEWRTSRDGGAVIGSAASGQPADYVNDTFVGPDAVPMIEIDELSVSYTAEPTPGLQVSGRVRLSACPDPQHRPIRVHAHGECDAAVRQGRFHAQFLVPPGDPEMIDVRVSIGGTTPPISSTTVTYRIPTALTAAELSIDELTFSERVFAGEVPKRIRFPLSGYAPQMLTLEFRPTAGEGGPRTVQARRITTTRTHAEYYLELDKDSRLTFGQSVPGAMVVAVVGQDPATVPPSRIELVPRLVRAVWEQLDSEAQLRITSGELNVDAIVGLGSIFDLRTTPGVATKDNSNRFRDPGRIVTNVLLAGGLTIALDDRSFFPAFPKDAATLCKSNAVTFTTQAGVSVRIAQGDPYVADTWAQILSARKNGNNVVLRLDGNVQALVSLHGLGKKTTLGQRIADADTLLAAKKAFGVFFRGFCFSAQLEALRRSLDSGGLLLKLSKPLHADDRVHPPVSAFLPMRVLRSADGDALAFWEPPEPPVMIQYEDPLPVHEQIGYVYQSGEESFWSRFPEADPKCRLRHVTFDNLVFSIKPDAIDFEGWWLPDGRGTFKASPPFRDYTFDFTEGACAAYEFELKDGAWRCTTEARWLSAQALAQLQTAIASAWEAKSGSLMRIPLAGRTVELRWRQRDAAGTVLVTATNVVDASEMELYALV